MIVRTRFFVLLLLVALPSAALADALTGPTERQPLNWTAIAMFAAFVALTLWITRWAAKRTTTAASFYTCLLYTSPSPRDS